MQASNALTQYRLQAADLEVLLALTRTGTLAEAARRLAVDASTVFRSVQRIERQLGMRLFERSRNGYLPSEQALTIAQHAERIETELEAARAAALRPGDAVAGLVRITTTDTLAHGLVLPHLARLKSQHTELRLELNATNELVNLTRRDADIAIRATRRPPDHLVGRRLGVLRVAVYGRAQCLQGRVGPLDGYPWIAPDEALPEHPTVRWRRKLLPRVTPMLLVNSISMVVDAVVAGLGIGALPVFLAERHAGLQALTEPLPECETEIWLLTHPESRHLRRIAAVASHLAEHIALP
jgi:DNA-binding transcriptional LysR family regulator